ncbi:hypothetical protein CASFOL_023447 [Castilleja foliolosa]|uniref:J domain-containing protein n=1 Tax=Castilleja foliolosa TaxID=1961234 RepID=A0ABD3CKL5_9LAMI
MGTHKRQSGQVETKPETHRFLTAADYFLHDRNFSDCRLYASRARDSDPTHPGPTRILAIATVLSAPSISSTLHDYYAVFSLPRFEPDSARIRSVYRTLASNLNPNVNPYSLAAEALDLVLRAWSVLSNPSEKARFDNELLRSCTSASGNGTFWTICPYCYYVYEYDRAYESCCLKCSNEKCRRVLHAVAIQAPPPPGDVVEKGQYLCSGFMPFGMCGGNGEEKRENMWSPFEPLVGSSSKGWDQNVACNGQGVVVDVSDDEMAVQMEFEDHGNGKRTKVEAGYNGGVKDLNGNKNGFLESVAKELKTMRKKSVPWNSKKLMGRGFTIDSNQACFDFNAYGNSNENENGGDDSEHEFEGEASNGVEGGVEFFEGDDDVLIGLESGFNVGNGDMSF